MSIAVVGNGSIARLRLLGYLSKIPAVNNYLWSVSRPFSASGRWPDVKYFSEIDCISCNLPLTQWKLKNSRIALDAWPIFWTFCVVADSVFTSSFTDVILRQSQLTPLKGAFDCQSSISASYGASVFRQRR